MSNGIFTRPFSSSCSRRIVATSSCSGRVVAARGHQIEELVYLHIPHLHSSHPHANFCSSSYHKLLLVQRAPISRNAQTSKSSSRARLTTTLCWPLKTVIDQPFECVPGTYHFYQVLSPVSVQHTAQGNHLRCSNRLVIILEHYATTVKFNVSRVKRRFSLSANIIELNEEQEGRRAQVGTLQVVAHTITRSSWTKRQKPGVYGPGRSR